MDVLLVYATYSSGTQQAAQTVSEELTKHNHTVTVKEVLEITPDDLGKYDLVILASPSWDFEGNEGMPHQHFLDFMKTAEGKTFPGRKFAILGLGDSSYTNFCGAVDHLEEFGKKLQGQLAIESLRIDGFFFNMDENTTKIREWATKIATLQ